MFFPYAVDCKPAICFIKVYLLRRDKVYLNTVELLVARELLYTGLTRAKQRLIVWGSEEVLRTAVTRRIRRSSGLKEALKTFS